MGDGARLTVGEWDHERARVGGTVTLPAEGWLTRPGESESQEALHADASRAADAGYPYGVSLRLADTRPDDGGAALVRATIARFRVMKTGAAADHFTLTFDAPLSEVDARAFDALFWPRP